MDWNKTKNDVIEATDVAATSYFYFGASFTLLFIVWWLISLSAMVESGGEFDYTLVKFAGDVASVMCTTFVCGIYKTASSISYSLWESKGKYAYMHELVVILFYFGMICLTFDFLGIV